MDFCQTCIIISGDSTLYPFVGNHCPLRGIKGDFTFSLWLALCLSPPPLATSPPPPPPIDTLWDALGGQWAVEYWILCFRRCTGSRRPWLRQGRGTGFTQGGWLRTRGEGEPTASPTELWPGSIRSGRERRGGWNVRRRSGYAEQLEWIELFPASNVTRVSY